MKWTGIKVDDLLSLDFQKMSGDDSFKSIMEVLDKSVGNVDSIKRNIEKYYSSFRSGLCSEVHMKAKFAQAITNVALKSNTDDWRVK